MCDFDKDKEQKRKSWNKRKAEKIQKDKHFVFNPLMVVSKEEAIKTYLELRKSHSKTLNQKIPIEINGKQYIIYPNGRIYKDKDLNDF